MNNHRLVPRSKRLAHPRLTPEEEQDLARRYRAGDKKAGEALIRDNMRWVLVHANRMQSARVPFEELVAEGNMGLVRALKKFDPDRGLRFMTYATHWIRAMIFHYMIYDAGSLVKIKHKRALEKIFFGRGRGLTAKDCEISQEEFDEIATHFDHTDWSLNVSINDHDRNVSASMTFQDMLPSWEPSAEEMLAQRRDEQDAWSRVHRAINRLKDPRQRAIMLQRHLAEEPLSLADIGKQFAVSRERIRQIEIEAIKNLKKALLSEMRDSGRGGLVEVA